MANKMEETPHAVMKRIAKELGWSLKDLRVLTANNDPFHSGTPAEKESAEWFVEWWRWLGFDQSRVHLRRMHYALVSRDDVERPDKGEGQRPYRNLEQDWQWLNAAARHARYQGLIDPLALSEHYNPDPHINHSDDNGDIGPGWEYMEPDWAVPSLDSESVLPAPCWRLPSLYPTKYEYRANLQPYLVEVWIEKSTMNDVLRPICDQLGVNLFAGSGFANVVNVNEFLQRVRNSGKDARVLYISDFDPAGTAMPIGVSRQIEFWRNGDDPHVKLMPIGLTQDQVVEYQLPRKPITDNDYRKGNFEQRYGQGAVELDALEALYPGELGRIVRDAVDQLHDLTLERRVDQDVYDEASDVLNQAERERIEPYREQLDQIHDDVESILARYRQQLRELAANLDEELKPHQKRIHALHKEVSSTLESLNPELPELPEPQLINEPDNGAWLFDSTRGYFEQLGAYTRVQEGNQE